MPHMGQGPHHLLAQSCLLLRAFLELALLPPLPSGKHWPGKAAPGVVMLWQTEQEPRAEDMEAAATARCWAGDGVSSCGVSRPREDGQSP